MENRQVGVEDIDPYDDEFKGDKHAWAVFPNYSLMRSVKLPEGFDEVSTFNCTLTST